MLLAPASASSPPLSAPAAAEGADQDDPGLDALDERPFTAAFVPTPNGGLPTWAGVPGSTATLCWLKTGPMAGQVMRFGAAYFRSPCVGEGCIGYAGEGIAVAGRPEPSGCSQRLR